MPGSFSYTRKLDFSRDQTQMIYNSFRNFVVWALRHIWFRWQILMIPDVKRTLGKKRMS